MKRLAFSSYICPSKFFLGKFLAVDYCIIAYFIFLFSLSVLQLMDLLFSFVKPDHPHSTLLSGYFSKVT